MTRTRGAWCAGAAIHLHLGRPDRIAAGRGSTGRRHRVTDDLLTDCRPAITLPTAENSTDGNLFGRFGEPARLRIQQPPERLGLARRRVGPEPAAVSPLGCALSLLPSRCPG
ncbi:MAG: hypothetical protein HY332_15600 [Chloroflexi bacterium]|nr:hypothetical protein [Chloroflexota bacterium]